VEEEGAPKRVRTPTRRVEGVSPLTVGRRRTRHVSIEVISGFKTGYPTGEIPAN
jgi:hypothetical protein